MNRAINQESGIESSIPLQQVMNYQINWEVNKHAGLILTGEMNPEIKGYLEKQYAGTEIELYLLDEEQGKGKTIFKGIVSQVRFEYGYGSCIAVIEGVSASKQLDCQRDSCSFQDLSMTYAAMARKTIEDAGGAIITTAGCSRMEKPSIRYKETAWEYVRRIASLCHTFLIPDIITGRSAIWFGMRKGIEASQLGNSWDCGEIIKSYRKNNRTVSLTSYRAVSRDFYRIGDYSEIAEQVCTIYKVRMEYKRGELLFTYYLANERELATKPYFNENFTGMSLSGTICGTEAENVYLKLDIDGKEGRYPYPWIPETGNALYAMPETGAPAALYFVEADEREAAGARCIHTDASQRHKHSDSKLKILETTSGGRLNLKHRSYEYTKNGLAQMMQKFCVNMMV